MRVLKLVTTLVCVSLILGITLAKPVKRKPWKPSNPRESRRKDTDDITQDGLKTNETVTVIDTTSTTLAPEVVSSTILTKIEQDTPLKINQAEKELATKVDTSSKNAELSNSDVVQPVSVKSDLILTDNKSVTETIVKEDVVSTTTKTVTSQPSVESTVITTEKTTSAELKNSSDATVKNEASTEIPKILTQEIPSENSKTLIESIASTTTTTTKTPEQEITSKSPSTETLTPTESTTIKAVETTSTASIEKSSTVESEVTNKDTTIKGPETTTFIPNSSTSVKTTESDEEITFAKLAHLIRTDVIDSKIEQKEIKVSAITPSTEKSIDDKVTPTLETTKVIDEKKDEVKLEAELSSSHKISKRDVNVEAKQDGINIEIKTDTSLPSISSDAPKAFEKPKEIEFSMSTTEDSSTVSTIPSTTPVETTSEKVFVIQAIKVTDGVLDFLSTTEEATTELNLDRTAKAVDIEAPRSIGSESSGFNFLSKIAENLASGVANLFTPRNVDKVVVSEMVSVTKVVKDGPPVEARDVIIKKPSELVTKTTTEETNTDITQNSAKESEQIKESMTTKKLEEISTVTVSQELKMASTPEIVKEIEVFVVSTSTMMPETTEIVTKALEVSTKDAEVTLKEQEMTTMSTKDEEISTKVPEIQTKETEITKMQTEITTEALDVTTINIDTTTEKLFEVKSLNEVKDSTTEQKKKDETITESTSTFMTTEASVSTNTEQTKESTTIKIEELTSITDIPESSTITETTTASITETSTNIPTSASESTTEMKDDKTTTIVPTSEKDESKNVEFTTEAQTTTKKLLRNLEEIHIPVKIVFETAESLKKSADNNEVFKKDAVTTETSVQPETSTTSASETTVHVTDLTKEVSQTTEVPITETSTKETVTSSQDSTTQISTISPETTNDASTIPTTSQPLTQELLPSENIGTILKNMEEIVKVSIEKEPSTMDALITITTPTDLKTDLTTIKITTEATTGEGVTKSNELRSEIIKAHVGLKLIDRPVVIEETPNVALDPVKEYVLVTKQIEKIPSAQEVRQAKREETDVVVTTTEATIKSTEKPTLSNEIKEIVDKTIQKVDTIVQDFQSTTVKTKTTTDLPEVDLDDISTANPAEVILEIPIPTGKFGSPPISEEFGRFFSHFN